MLANALQLEQWPIGRLVEYERNPRKNDDVVDRMAQAIMEFGFRIPIVARSDGLVVDGHLRLKAARVLGLDTVPVVLADELSETQIKAFRLLANQSANWAEWDELLLSAELNELLAQDYDLSLIGFEDAELEALLAGEVDPEAVSREGEDDVPEAPETPISRPGDLWLLGKHRLLCGDATVATDVERLLDGSRSKLCFCDPPYNVDYAGGVGAQKAGRERRIKNDALGDGFGQFLYDACVLINLYTDGAVYICMSSSELHTLQAAFKEAGGHWSTFVIWAKDRFTLGRSDYQRQYEPILYGWPERAKRHWCGDRDQGDVWQITRPHKNDLHPTMKPVALVERAIRNSSQRGDLVFDPFGGSGTTLIAAETTGRRAALLELDPKYVDVIIRRWQEFSGLDAQLVDTGRSFVEETEQRQVAHATVSV